MAAAGGRPRPSLIEALFAQPRRFAFAQAVRILEAAGRRAAPRSLPRADVGERAEPQDEAVRFRAAHGTAFPPSEITALENADDMRSPPRMSVAFLGLTGPSGVLPQHYSFEMMRSIRAKNLAFQDFLDLFNHRLVSLFLRASTKYRLPLSYERNPQDDRLSAALRGVVGIGGKSVQNRTDLNDETLLHYSGLYAHFPRSAAGLEAILSDYFARPARVEQFYGRWMALAPPEQSTLPTRLQPDGQHCRLGQGATIGARVWDVQGSFRLHLGPLDYRQFLDFMPSGVALRQLAALTELYVGPSLVFDVRLTLRKEHVPRPRLGGAGEGTRLGWNAWLSTTVPPHDVSDAVFFRRTLVGAKASARRVSLAAEA